MSEEEKIAKKKQAQRDAWQRWWKGPKGEAYRAKRRKRPLQEVAK